MNPNVVVGSVEGTGASLNVQLGFQPTYVKCVNIDATNPAQLEWFEGMAAASANKLTGGASPGHTKISSNGISQYAGTRGGDEAGFSIGADAAVNVSGQTIAYLAIRDGAGAG